MIPYNEREVLKLLQEESTQRKGFEMIVAQYSEQLYWQIRRMVLSHEDANDLLQNTFIKAWTNIDYFRAEAKLSTWLYRIALNECLTFLNKQRAMTTVDIDDPEAAIVQKLESRQLSGIQVLGGRTTRLYDARRHRRFESSIVGTDRRCPQREPAFLYVGSVQ